MAPGEEHETKLLVEIGNTSVQLGYADKDLHSTVKISNDELDKIVHQWETWVEGEKPSDILLTSVAPGKAEQIVEYLASSWDKTPQQFRETFHSPLRVNVNNPEELGEDRLLNATAAWNRYQTSCVIVDAGTAITVDVISESGAFEGGVILPGVGMTSDALHTQCELLPQISPRPTEQTIGQDTTSALQSGLYHGFVGMLDQILQEVCSECDSPPTIIGLGGDISFFQNHSSSFFDHMDQELTLKGLLDCWHSSSTNASTLTDK